MKRVGLALLLVGCSHASVAPVAVPAAPPPPDPAVFARGEDEILRDLSAIDRRFAKRAHVTPSEDDLRRVAMAAILHEDPTLAVIDGAIDPFSFDARARGLEAVKVRLAALPSDGVERELLARVVDAEVVRLEEERMLPRSASALVHAIVDNWDPPKDERDAADDDRWLARRLNEVLTAMNSTVDPNATLDVVRVRALDDALDQLEPLVTGLPNTTRALVKLREGVESISAQPAAKAHLDWDLVGKRLRAQLGVMDDPAKLAADFSVLEANLRARVEAETAAMKPDRSLGTKTTTVIVGDRPLGLDAGDPLHARLLETGTCVDAVGDSRVRSMAAPPEREPLCLLRKSLLAIHESDALTLELLHDHVVVAQWALEVARGDATIAQTQGRHHLLTPPRFDERARFERIALARPASAIGAGYAVEVLVGGDRHLGDIHAGDIAARVKAWQALGDIPLDIAARELK